MFFSVCTAGLVLSVPSPARLVLNGIAGTVRDASGASVADAIPEVTAKTQGSWIV
jgi:hypothetical protein